MMAFMPYLAPDSQRILAWLISETLAWLQSATPGVAAATGALFLYISIAIAYIAFDALIRVFLRNVQY